ncbi:MAG: DNA topoisomerase IV subunit A, partial [Alphaproteobacteria bacterium]|nr:DNA topoisomerase IV subunit A [Alphaproteobacteria bacterium]
ALMPSEPVTVIISEQGWVRYLKGHDFDALKIVYRQDDTQNFLIEAQSQQSLLLFAENGRFYTLSIDKLPSGKGHGEPIHLLLKSDGELKLIMALPYNAEQKLLVASSAGRGLIVPTAKVVAQTKSGKRVLYLGDNETAVHCSVVQGEWLACLNKQQKLLIFPTEQVPELNKGRGMMLQQCKGTRFIDAQTFSSDNGPTWVSKEGRRRQLPDWQNWTAQRARAGKMLPKGMPKGKGFITKIGVIQRMPGTLAKLGIALASS